MEAHGGYAFCGIAALTLLGHERLCDLDALLVSDVIRNSLAQKHLRGTCCSQQFCPANDIHVDYDSVARIIIY